MPDPIPIAQSPPIRPSNLEFLRKQAKSLLRDFQRGEPAAVARLAAGAPGRDSPGLADAQLALARELGFASWSQLRKRFDRVHKFNGVPSTDNESEAHMSTSTSTLGLGPIDQINLTCTDLDKAQQFYCNVLGLRAAGEIPGMAKFFDCAGVNIIMFKAEKVAPNSIIYFKVEPVRGRIEEKVKQLRDLGADVTQDAQCIAQNWHGYDVYLAFFKDPFGNQLGLKSDVPAK